MKIMIDFVPMKVVAMDSDSKFLVTGGHDKMVKVLFNLVFRSAVTSWS